MALILYGSCTLFYGRCNQVRTNCIYIDNIINKREIKKCKVVNKPIFSFILCRGNSVIKTFSKPQLRDRKP